MRASITASSWLGWLSFLGALGVTSNAQGQGEGPEPPLPPPLSDSPEATEDSADRAPTSEAEADPWDDPVPADPTVVEPTIIEPPPAPAAANEPPSDYETWYRRASTHEQNTLGGSTGLLRVRQAGSGAAGTFRFGLIGGFFAQSGFLCSADAPCRDPVTGFTQGPDDAQRVEALATLSVTPFSFLEAYLTVRNSATSNSNGRPQLLQVLGDSSLGVKAFSPAEADQLFYYGGEAELGLLTGTGGVGLDGGATSFALRALGTLDLNNRTKVEERLPLRLHTNLGYFFDNSAAVISSLESTPPPAGRGAPIQRTERYGLNLSRVDAFQIGLGLEYLHDYVRPFLEWTLDVPVNRQGYVCNLQGAASRGDLCLGAAASLPTSPSRLSLGARVFPWQASGLALTAALDIGTGGTTRFLEETKPETPYSLWFGLAYAVDTVAPPPQLVAVAVPAASEQAVRRIIVGRVMNLTGDAAIPDAILRFESGDYTGMVADAEGRFRSGDLPAGTYTFHVFADQYREGTCQVVVPESVAAYGTDGEGWGPSESGAPVDPYGEQPAADSEPARTAQGDIEVPLTCTLKELPRVANVIGLLIDAKTGTPVPDATITITDKLSRSLTLAADAQGSLLFQNVPFGVSHLTASAPGYLTTVMPIDVDSRKELQVHVVLNKRPQKLSVELGTREIKLTQPISFVGETPEVTADTLIVVEELATLLRENEKLGQLEIQVHADDAGAPSYSRRLTQERADNLRSLLVQMGVDEARLVAKGYGPDQPLTPNVSDASREKNRRVQVLILKR